jgi:hypothetical protein
MTGRGQALSWGTDAISGRYDFRIQLYLLLASRQLKGDLQAWRNVTTLWSGMVVLARYLTAFGVDCRGWVW